MGFIEDLARLYTPLPREQLQGSRTNRYLAVFGRLKSGVSPEQTQAQMDLVAERLAQQYPSNKNIGIVVVSLQNLLVSHIRTAFLVLHGAVACLLLIACANVSNLLLARSNARAQEIAVRSALGARRARIFQQMLTESLLLGLLGGGLGVILACWGLEGLKLFAPKMPQTGGNLPGFDEIHLDTAVLGFTVVLSTLTAAVFGLLPAWRTSGCRFREILSQCGYFRSEGPSRQRTLGALVISQIALALILLSGSGLLIRSFARLQAVDLGFVPRGLLAFEMERPDIPASRESSRRARFYEQAVKQLAELPGVESVCAVSLHPMSPRNFRTTFEIADATLAGKQSTNGEYRTVTSDYFRCMKIPLLKGRYFPPSDRTTGENVAIVNQEFVRKSLLEEDPIGKSVTIHGAAREIIGVVGDVKVFSPVAQDIEPIVYEPIRQNCPHGMTILLRTAQEPMLLVGAARRAIWEIDSGQPILRVQTMNQIVADTISIERFCMLLFLVMGCAALLMAMTGIYAIVAYAVSERRREIGIRMALGADERDMLSLAMRRAVGLSIAGLAVGFIGAFLLTRCMSGLLFQISPTDPVTFLLVPIVLLATALLASYIPARRATKIDPMVALRYE
jgi:putative ABC transport system permease protein